LRYEKIIENDLSVIAHFGIKDWSGKKFDEALLLEYGNWVVNDDKSVIFKALGGGSFEIPEMYDLVYKGTRIRLECGGGGTPPKGFVKNDDQSYDITVFLAHIYIPPELAHEQDSVLASAVEGLAVVLFRFSKSGKLTVKFSL
jgi:hypothetical protein